ncbi:MAG: hypothetical protein JWM30_1126 [Burkholderia sp.]|nr:hypothetical protein [Burkholderia sp.]
MVLATRCPHCRTTFRVVQDQLKLRGGLVRCGACKEIFNGTENLLRPIDASANSTRPPATDAAAAASAADEQPSAAAPSPPPSPSPSPPEPPSPTQTSLPAPDPAAPLPASAAPQPDPLLRMTLMDFSPDPEDAEKSEDETTPAALPSTDYSLPRMAAAAPAPAVDQGDELARAIDDMKSKPWRGMTQKRARVEEDAIDALDSAEPDFVVRARQRQRVAQSRRIALLAASGVLALLLAVQLLIQFRVPLAAQSPAAATLLTGACRLFGCTVGLPAYIDMVTIESSELQALPGSADTFTLLALLRNRSATRQQWPHLELTLNDANEAPVARRVIAPRDYLPPSQNADDGFPPNSEQSARLVFSLAQVKAAGFRVYVFYP